MATRRHAAHGSFWMDESMRVALEEAATRDERTKSDWIRAVVKRELRNLGLLPEVGTPKSARRSRR